MCAEHRWQNYGVGEIIDEVIFAREDRCPYPFAVGEFTFGENAPQEWNIRVIRTKCICGEPECTLFLYYGVVQKPIHRTLADVDLVTWQRISLPAPCHLEFNIKIQDGTLLAKPKGSFGNSPHIRGSIDQSAPYIGISTAGCRGSDVHIQFI